MPGTNLRLVGAVAIKVRPDSTGFRRETNEQVRKELAGVNAKVKVKVDADTGDVDNEVERAAKATEKRNKITLKVGVDYDSVKAAQAQLEREIAKTKRVDIEVDLDKKGSIKAARKELEKLAAKSKVIITYASDEQGYRDVLAKIEAIRRDKITQTVKYKTDDASLNALEKEFKDKLASVLGPAKSVTMSMHVEPNRESLQRAIDKIDSEINNIPPANIEIELDHASLIAKREELKRLMSQIPVTIEVDDNLRGYEAAKAKLEALLHIGKLTITTNVDEFTLREQLAMVEAKIKAASPEVKVKPNVSEIDYLKTAAALKILTRDQTVTIFAKLNATGLLFTAAKLTGLRAAGRWAEEFGRSLGTLDRNLPIVTGVTLAISNLSAAVTSLLGNIFSLGNDLGMIVRSAGILAPAMLLGLGATMLVVKGIFKDFGAAVNGDSKAIEKLSASGQRAAAKIRVVFQDIRETVSKNFWDTAGSAMERFADTSLPTIGKGFAALSTSLGGIFSHMLDSFNTLSNRGGLKFFFDNLVGGFDNAQHGMADFMNGFNTLAVVGSTVFPRLGKAFDEWAAKFDGWVQRLAADGTLVKWIDQGIQGIVNLGKIASGLIKIWANFGKAAQEAGAVTLSSFAEALDRVATITAGGRFQTNMKTIFKGAKEGVDIFYSALGNLGPAMDVFSVTLAHLMTNAATSFGALSRIISDIISSPGLDHGLTSFLQGTKNMFEALRPAAAYVVTIIDTFGQILGRVATDSGPLFRDLFKQLAGVLTNAWTALAPFLPALIQIGTNIINILGPALSTIASDAIPSFSASLQRVGESLTPVISFLADLAVGFVAIVSVIPTPVLAYFVGTILALNTAFQAAAIIVPIATGVMKAMGIAAGVTAIQSQLLIPVVGLVLAALSGLVLAGVSVLGTAQQSNTTYANEYADALRDDAKAAGEFGSAIGDATTKLTIKKLIDSGAYDAAKKLGIGTQQVTDAILKGGPAWDDIQKKIAAARDAYHDNADAAILSNGAVGDSATVTADAAGAADKLDAALNPLKGSLDAGRDSNKQYADAAHAAGIKTDEEREAAAKLEASLRNSNPRLGAFADAMKILNDAASSASAKLQAFKDAMDAINGKTKSAEETTQAYNDDVRSMASFLKDATTNHLNLNASIDKTTGAINTTTEAGSNLRTQLSTLTDNAVNIAINLKESGAKPEAISAKLQKLKDDWVAQATAAGISAASAGAAWDHLIGGIPKTVATVITANVDSAKANIEDYSKILAGVDGWVAIVHLLGNDEDLANKLINSRGKLADFNKIVATATAKLDPTQAEATRQQLLLNLADLARTDPTVLAKMDPTLLNQTQAAVVAKLQELGRMKPTPEVQAATKNAMDQLNAVVTALNNLNGKVANVSVNYNETTRKQSIDYGTTVVRNGQPLPTNASGSMTGTRFLPQMKRFANGGIENHIAQIAMPRGNSVRIWAEKETQGEAYIPLAASKRPRSMAILEAVAAKFGVSINKAQRFSDGNTVSAPGATTNANVNIGVMHTHDPDEAVRRMNQARRDALAVAGQFH